MIKKNMLKKLLASTLLASFLLLNLFVPVVRAQSPIRCGLEGEPCCNLAGSPPDSCQKPLECQLVDNKKICVAPEGTTNPPRRGEVTPSTRTGGGTWYNSSFQEWWTKVYDSPESEIFGERYTAAQVEWIIYGLFAFLLNGMSNGNTEALSCVMNNQIDQCVGALENLREGLPLSQQPQDKTGVLNVFTTRPISSIEYFKDVNQRIKLVPEAHAQGFGFGAANPILTFWKISRNLAYALLTLAIVVIAFLIMFRVKISPQTVITVQSALPKIVIALILITFSYAIAGFLIDLMYVVIGLIAAILSQSGISEFGWTDLFRSIVSENNIFLLFMHYWVTFVIAAISNFLGSLNVFIPGAASLGGALVSLLLVVLALLSIIVLLLFTVKTIWMLLKTYVQILLLIIVAPLQILLGTVASGTGFGSWLRSMAGNLSVYPVVTFLFILAFVFLRAGLPQGEFFDNWMPFNIQWGVVGGDAWDPPLTFGTGQRGSSILWVLVSFGIIAMIPKTADLIKSMIERKPFGLESLIGRAEKATLMGYGAYAAGQLITGGAPIPFGSLIPTRVRKPLGRFLEGAIRSTS